ncbi:MAG: nucleotidyltransferase domain-containing protein [Candidatus Babeliales bacterium]|jgi:predicted nucleotidyltransferase
MKKNMSPEQFQEMFKVTPEKVAQVVHKLVATYNPISIYAFGSYASGKYDDESDFDVMTVIDEYDDKPWRVIARGYGELHGIQMPIDLLVYDLSKFEECKKDSTSFCHTILKTGKLLYERKKS